MIDYYRIPTKKTELSQQQILTITQEHQFKDAIHNQSILYAKVLNLRNSNINDDTLSLLWTISQTLQITHINLSENFSFVTDVGIDHLCQSFNLKNLKSLNLADNSITDESLLKMSKTAHFLKLQELTLYGNSDVSSASLIYLAQSSIIKELVTLDLHDTSICDEGLQIFIRSPNSANLTHLNVSMNYQKVTDRFLAAISTSPYAASLISLKLQDCFITDEGIQMLCDSPNCSKIQTLNLNNSVAKKNNLITDGALKSLTYAKQMCKLKVLELRNTDITSNGINSLSVSLTSQNFETLRFSYCLGIKEDALLYLESIIKYRTLLKLYINSTSITHQAATKLSEKYPILNLVF